MDADAYPLTAKALAQYRKSHDVCELYGTYGTNVDHRAGLDALVRDSLKAIENGVDRLPEEEGALAEKSAPKNIEEYRDVLKAATILLHSADVVVAKHIPDNIAEYGAPVEKIVRTFFSALNDPFTASSELRQIGLAVLIGNKKSTLIESERALYAAITMPPATAYTDMEKIRDVMERLERGVKESRAAFTRLATGEQPHLESEAGKALEEIVASDRQTIEQMKQAVKTAQTRPGGRRKAGFTP